MSNERKPFAVGNEVAILDRGDSIRIGRVARVLKRYVVLDCGSQWGPDGFPYPRDAWPRAHIVFATDAHWAAVVRARIVKRINGGALASWALADLVELYRRLKPASDATEGTP